MKKIYLDYAATTPTDLSVFKTAVPYFKQIYFNPSSVHAQGRLASAAVERAREKCAAAINASPDEIYFTSGGTEAINWAMKCSLKYSNGKHVVISAIEHDSVFSCANRLKEYGYIIDTVMPTSGGTITPDALKSVITVDNTALVCVMTVNNQTGAIQPIKELAAVAHGAGALFFTDAVQAVNSTVIDVANSGVDMLALSGHKFYAPKGSGFLYVKKGVRIDSLIDGGGQEREKRAGTVDVPAVVAMGEAIEKARGFLEENNAHIKTMTDLFLSELTCGQPIYCDSKINDIISVVFDGVNGGRLAVALSLAGVSCSVGSACSAGSAVVPPTLVAMNVRGAENAVRFSFGRYTTEKEAIRAAKIVNRTVRKLS